MTTSMTTSWNQKNKTQIINRLQNSTVFLILIVFGLISPAISHAASIITGTVTDPGYEPISGIAIKVFDHGGVVRGETATNQIGQWSVRLPVAGSYYVGTSFGVTFDVTDEVWSGIACDGCDPADSGTPIFLDGISSVHGINFHLKAEPTAPIFSDSFEPTIEPVIWRSKYARITTNGRKVFYNGLNLAWQHFANDLGSNLSHPQISHFEQVFQKLQAAGGNSMRLWIHTTGAFTPQWDELSVIGPGDDLIDDLQLLLDLAHQYDVQLMLCLWSFDMMDKLHPQLLTDRSREILTKQNARQSYMDNALTPIVSALKGHPAILAWEIFNEAEGMSEELGWPTNYQVPMSDIQAFVNQASGAIHRADPLAKVTTGALGFVSITDVGRGNYNYYSDERLIDAGSDLDGTLDFYSSHYYIEAGKKGSPFHFPASYWQLDKPIVIAEHYPDCKFCGPDPHQSLYDNGYAGALGWSWTDRDEETLLAPIVNLSTRHAKDIILNPEERPLVELVEPNEDQILYFHEDVTLRANASDPDGSIDSVEFYQENSLLGVDSSEPFSWTFRTESLGNTSFFALAVDDDGNRARTPRRHARILLSSRSARLEAEAAESVGLTRGTDPTASAGRYMDMRQSGTLTWTVPLVNEAGEYYLIIGYKLPYETPKIQNLKINNGSISPVVFDGPLKSWEQKIMKVNLQAGGNSIEITASWGFMYFDYIALIPVSGS